MAVIVKTPGPSEDLHSGWFDVVFGQIVIIKTRKQSRINGILSLSGNLILLGMLVID